MEFQREKIVIIAHISTYTTQCLEDSSSSSSSSSFSSSSSILSQNKDDYNSFSLNDKTILMEDTSTTAETSSQKTQIDLDFSQLFNSKIHVFEEGIVNTSIE